MRSIALFGAVALLAGCGQQQNLHPRAGASLPPKPATSPAVPTPDDLLADRPTVRPARSDELLTKSQPRPDDPFDQPPR